MTPPRGSLRGTGGAPRESRCGTGVRSGLRSRLAALALLAVAVPPGCSPRETSPGTPPDPPPVPLAEPAAASPRLVVVRKGAAAPTSRLPVVRVDVAANQETRQRGLGGRERLGADEGMLFVYPAPVHRSFWMKDCSFGLDIAFVAADGRIVRLATLGPGAGLPEPEIPRADSGVPVLYVLETEAGWLRRHGVREGDRIDVAAAVAGVVAE